jgi:hypothetical protein
MRGIAQPMFTVTLKKESKTKSGIRADATEEQKSMSRATALRTKVFQSYLLPEPKVHFGKLFS